MTPSTASSQAPAVIARSALLTLVATPTDHALSLRVERNLDHRLISGPGRVTATLDGHLVPLGAGADGSYLLSTRGQSGGSHSLTVVASHDGIRELLTATVALPEQRSILDSLEGHGMAAWWVLNIAVVLIAVVVISRRRR